MSRSWISALPAYTDKSVSRRVGDKDLTFYPVSPGMLFNLRRVAEPVAKVVAGFMGGDEAKDAGYENRVIKMHDDEGRPEEQTHVKTVPPTLDVVQYRDQQRSQRITEAIEALTSDQAQGVFGQIILDSLRPRDDRNQPTEAEGREFFCSISSDLLPGYCHGLLDANKEVLGPFVEKVAEMRKTLDGRMEDAVARASTRTSPSTLSDDGDEKTTATEPASV